MRPYFIVLFLLSPLFFIGCGNDSTSDQPLSSEEKAIADEMLMLDYSLFDGAWQNLKSANDNIQATTPDSSFTVSSADDDGEFDLTSNPLPHFYPNDPPFLASRGRENYLFRKSEDSTNIKYTVLSNPSAGGLNVITQVEVYVNKLANKVIHITLVRNQKNQFFAETGNYEAKIAQNNSGLWLPKLWAFDVLISLPFQEDIKSSLSVDYTVN